MVRCFLIGAGASAAQSDILGLIGEKLPLNKDFLSQLEYTCPAEFASLYEVYRDYSGNESTGSFTSLTLEDFSNLARTFEESTQKTILKTLYKSIHKLISKPSQSTLNKVELYLSGNYSGAPPYYEQLLETCDENDFFVSLNYDLILDRCIMRERTIRNVGSKSIDYGLDPSHIRTDTTITVQNDNKFTVYKPHGSVNWQKSGGGDKIFISLGALDQDNPTNENLVAVLPINKEPEFPSNLLWEIATERAKKADELIILGCSLQKEDKMLIKFIDEWKLSGNNKVKIVCSSNNRIRYEELFGKLDERNFFAKGFRTNCISTFIFPKSKQ